MDVATSEFIYITLFHWYIFEETEVPQTTVLNTIKFMQLLEVLVLERRSIILIYMILANGKL